MAMLLPLYVLVRTEALKRAPLQVSHSFSIGSRKLRSTLMTPKPLQLSQAPTELKLQWSSGRAAGGVTCRMQAGGWLAYLNRPGLDFVVLANRLRMWSMAPV